MARPTPREVFENPQAAWEFLTQSVDDDVEGQHFDRKEAGRSVSGATISSTQLSGLKDLVRKTISAFANSNVEGGLLILGISSTGEVLGIDHLQENQLNSITNLNTLLRAHAAEVKCHPCQDVSGSDRTVCLIYSAHVQNAICETNEAVPRAWIRHGQQSLPMSQDVREQIRIRKGMLDQDSLPFCEFIVDDLDVEVVKEFRLFYHPETTSNFSDERLLREAGAIVQNNGKLFFTLPGLLFFASNPQRNLTHAYLRLLKFAVSSDQYYNRGTPIFDKDFKGPITKQIRAARTFLRETAFFIRFQFRKPDGGFAEQPELPTIAVDEAIVNAVAHRDYHTRNPIYCEHYKNAFVVKNPGRMRQQNVDLPNHFNLSTTQLDSMPLNRKLIEWLRLMKDPDGNAFVQALSEGTKRMTRDMLALELPPPSVVLYENETILKLESKSEERQATFLASVQVPKTAFMNIYLLTVSKGSGGVTREEIHLRLGELSKALRDSLSARGWYIDRFSFSRIVVHRKGAEIPISETVNRVLRFIPAYCIQIHEFFGKTYISIDYTCQVLSVLRANEVGRYIDSKDLIGQGCVAQAESWQNGRILSIDNEWVIIHFFDNDEERKIEVNKVIPSLSLVQIEIILRAKHITLNLYREIKKNSLATETGAARKRAEKIQNTAEQIAESIFPIIFGEYEARMENSAIALSEFESKSSSTFHMERLSEPTVEFRHHKKLPDVREGITKYGSYDSIHHNIELVPICLSTQRQEMKSLIERLKTGKFKYRGAELTFSTRFTYSTIITVDSIDILNQEVKRILSENPTWTGNASLERLFLVHTPEEGYSKDDEKSPYFIVKRQLLEAGIPCQMVDTTTLNNPDWKDLNLSLNIVAKCGIVPWVLPENIPDADFFVGLSYTQSKDGQKILGFANVFNSYGKWEFYAGNTTAFDTSKRSEKLANLVRTTLQRLKRDLSLPVSPNLIFHHSVRISKDDYKAILYGVRSVAQDASVSFVWINSHNNFRLFDSRPETDGSIQRGSFVPISRRRVLLSTTGYNTYRKNLGTPRPLEISSDKYRSRDDVPVECEARTMALQILNLTKLNWASTDSFTAEPITIKYAGNIAYLTAAFIRHCEPFKLHKVLERTPWFI